MTITSMLIPITMLVLSITVGSLPTCEQALTNFKDYTCTEHQDQNRDSTTTDTKKTFVIEKKTTHEQFLLTVMVTTSKNESENIDIYHLRLAQGSKYVLALVDTRIDDDYTYIITERPTNGKLIDFIQQNDYFNNNANILQFIRELQVALSYLHYKGIVHTNITYETIYIRSDNTIVIGDFEKSVIYNSFYIKIEDMSPNDPYISKVPIGNQVHFNEKIDIWSVGQLLYFLIHKKNLRIEARHAFNTLNNTINTVPVIKGVDVRLIKIMDTCLKIRPSMRISSQGLYSMLHDMMAETKLEVSDKPLYINLDYPVSEISNSMLEKFSELLFVIFLVLMVIPLSVYLVSKKIKADEENEALGVVVGEQND